MSTPNPTTGKFTIEHNLQNKSAIRSFEIFNLIGDRVYSDFSLGRQISTELDLSGDKGIYLIKVCSGSGVQEKQLVIY